MKQIIVATKNRGKAKEFQSFFAQRNIEALSLLDLDETFPEIEETGDTFESNAAIKAQEICQLVKKPIVADDSGLVIDALDGKPGIYSARYAGEDKDDLANMEKVLDELKDVEDSKRTARFVCVLALARPNEETKFVKGICEGKISFTPKGTNGFGYDPIFIPNGFTKTMAELSAEEKNEISHRRKAFDQLDELLNQLQSLS